jgi:hypothetical protein
MTTGLPPLSAEHHYLYDWVCRNAPGKANAVPLVEVADATGIPQRRVQTMKAELLENGLVLCSSCSKMRPGIYAPTDASEVAPYARQLEHRIMACSHSLQTLYRMHPALRPVVLRTPPLRHENEGANVTAQTRLEV